jgi:hypothetical protein
MTAWLRQTRTAVLAVSLAATGLSLGAGCTDTLGTDRDRSDSRSDTRDRAGDPQDPPPGVPRTARLVKREFGELNFRAPDDGTMWVVESTNNSVIYEKAVRRGDEFRLDPERNRAYLNDRPVIDRDVKPDIRHRIFFESDLRRSSSDRYGDTEWDLASDRERARARDRDRDLDRDLGDDRISRDPYRY